MKIKTNNDLSTLNEIKSIVVLYDAKMINGEDINTYLIVEDISDQQIIFNITKGEEYINDNTKQIDYTKRIKTKKLYLDDYKNNISKIKYGPTDTIMYHKSAVLRNTSSKKKFYTTDILEFKDIYGNKIFIDIKYNNIYTKNTFDITENTNTVKKLIYKPNIQINISKTVFNHTLHNISKLFIDYVWYN